MNIKTFDKTVAATGTPEALSPVRLEVSRLVIGCPAGNTSDILIGDSTGQTFPIAKGTQREIPLTTGINNKPSELDLSTVFVKVGTNNDKANVLYTYFPTT